MDMERLLNYFPLLNESRIEILKRRRFLLLLGVILGSLGVWQSGALQNIYKDSKETKEPAKSKTDKETITPKQKATRTTPDWQKKFSSSLKDARGSVSQQELKELPRPWIKASSNFGPQINNQSINQPGEISYTVSNMGNFAAITCYTEVYEGPGGYDIPLSGYELRGRKVITLQPGEEREVSLPWVRTRQSGRIVGIAYDPVLDPKNWYLDEETPQYNRHVTSIHFHYK
jgi:hypothetical protein